MGDLKFRYWDTFDKKEPKMIYFNFNKLSAGTVYPDMDSVMQSRECKDLNGNDIYEGDIVKEDTNIAIVRFGEYQANNNRMYQSETAYGFYLEYLSHKGVIDHATKLNWYEVIGNIYENPELLMR